MLNLTSFAHKLGNMIEQHLSDQEAARQLISRLAAGAAFEAWLSFESRLLLEANRAAFELNELCCDRHGCAVNRYFITNEYQKVDLGISTEEQWVAAVEFKIIHNNKNWMAKCAEVERDLWPAPGTSKAKMELAVGRLAAVLVIGKVYRDKRTYPGQRTDLDVWYEDLWKYLLRAEARVQRLWQSRRFRLTGERLFAEVPGVNHFCEMHLLARAES